jgi:N-acetyl-gamma-glutamylphosphate reductase
MKGAASQAVQAFNVKLGLPEDAGLRMYGMNP